MKIKYALRGVIKRILKPITKHFYYTIRYAGRDIKLRSILGFFYDRNSLKPEERREAEFFQTMDFKGKTIYDVGSANGKICIFFAISAGTKGKVVSFEPNPESYGEICDNIKLNGLKNIIALNLGAGDKEKRETLAVRLSEQGTGSMEEFTKSQIINEKDYKIYQVKIDTVDNCIKKYELPPPAFVKVDVEGMEYNVLIGMKETIEKYKPALFIELHQSKVSGVAEIARFLTSHAYIMHHIESGMVVTPDDVHISSKGHIYCTWRR